MAPAQRSERMALIRSRDTAPELILRRRLHAIGYRYRLHDPSLPGRPDVVFKSRKKVIFVHGCFWHMHEGCALCRPPKSRLDYWSPKLRRNAERDKISILQLGRMGWKSLVIWECETRDPERMIRKAARFLGC
jgi:DNA mismatch endonuclease (patch repair protein)